MRIVIAGAHGQVARRLGRLLSGRGDTAVGIIRNPAHSDDLRADGVEPVVLDLERPAARGRLLAVAAAAPRLDEALRAVSRSLGTPDGSAAAQVLSAALVGRLTDLVALLEHELGHERDVDLGELWGV